MMKKIAVFTSTRADYGLLLHLMKGLNEDSRCELHLLVTGTHLSEKFGFSSKLIDRSIFKNIHELAVDVEKSESEFFSETLTKSSILLNKVSLDSCIILGDRFEALAFALAAFMKDIPIVHLHGGELTLGAKDDAYRHCITKLAKLHLTAHAEYSKRVIQLGEQPESVITTGPFGLDYLKDIPKKSLKDLGRELDFEFKNQNLLITLHPETHALDNNSAAIAALLKGLESLPDCGFLFTMPNMDTGGDVIRKHITAFCEGHPDKAKVFENLGSTNYLSLMSHMDAVVGNSSSGIYEAPYLKIPTLNIGLRQEGRIKASSVVDVDFDSKRITQSLQHILTHKQQIANSLVYPFGNGDTSSMAKETILTYDFSHLKRFYDTNK